MSVDAARNDVSYARDNYFSKTNYIKVNGQPALLVFGPQKLTNPTDWTNVLSGFVPKPALFTLWYNQNAGGNATRPVRLDRPERPQGRGRLRRRPRRREPRAHDPGALSRLQFVLRGRRLARPDVEGLVHAQAGQHGGRGHLRVDLPARDVRRAICCRSPPGTTTAKGRWSSPRPAVPVSIPDDAAAERRHAVHRRGAQDREACSTTSDARSGGAKQADLDRALHGPREPRRRHGVRDPGLRRSGARRERRRGWRRNDRRVGHGRRGNDRIPLAPAARPGRRGRLAPLQGTAPGAGVAGTGGTTAGTAGHAGSSGVGGGAGAGSTGGQAGGGRGGQGAAKTSSGCSVTGADGGASPFGVVVLAGARAEAARRRRRALSRPAERCGRAPSAAR